MYAKHSCNFCNVCVKNFCLALTVCGLGLQTVTWEIVHKNQKKLLSECAVPTFVGLCLAEQF